MYTHSPTLRSAAALLLVLGALSPAFGQDSPTEAPQIATRQLTAQDQSRISASAVKVLRDIAGARGDLHNSPPDLDQAREQLDRADHTLDEIRDLLPTAVIADRIWIAKKHLEYEDTKSVLPDLVPIYASLDELVDAMPTSSARTHLDQAQEALEKGDKAEATQQLQAVDKALLYVEADLPLSSTRQLITQARADLAKQDTQSADQALADAEGNVVFVSIGIESPLTQAKTSLWRAWKDRERNRFDYAKAELSRAVTYLDQAAQSSDPVTRDAAASLISEVRELNRVIAAGDKPVGRRLERAWEQVKALSERSAEYISTGWQRMRAGRKDKRQLIEAKLHLADARIDHLYSSDDDAARAELAETKGYLDAALPLVDKPDRPNVQKLIARVDSLSTSLSQQGAGHEDATAFQQTEAQLSDLIHRL